MLCEQVRGHESFEEMVHVLAGTWMNSSPSNVCVYFSNKKACVQAAPRLTFSWLGLHVLHFFKRCVSSSVFESVTSKAALFSSSELEKKGNPSTHISQLPTEIMLRLFHYLGPEDLCRCSQVCSSWSELAKTGSLWRHLYPVHWARGKLLRAGDWNRKVDRRVCSGGALLINVCVS